RIPPTARPIASPAPTRCTTAKDARTTCSRRSFPTDGQGPQRHAARGVQPRRLPVAGARDQRGRGRRVPQAPRVVRGRHRPVDRGHAAHEGPHLLQVAVELSHAPAILGAYEDLLGPDYLVLASRFWIKDPQDRKFVTWHQDCTYFGLDPELLITCWLALTPVTAKN